MRLEYAENRASAHANSFNPSKMTPDYYRGFMQAPGYDPDLDTVVVAPDGRFAAFTMGWIDPANRVGTFEPVGTHREFQRRGLGKAALLEGMRRLQARDMMATVGCHAHNPGNRSTVPPG
jgi:ribosomal protein S18 acetylase RimI-like enzyme